MIVDGCCKLHCKLCGGKLDGITHLVFKDSHNTVYVIKSILDVKIAKKESITEWSKWSNKFKGSVYFKKHLQNQHQDGFYSKCSKEVSGEMAGLLK